MPVAIQRKTLWALAAAVGSVAMGGLPGGVSRAAVISTWSGATSTAWSNPGNWDALPTDDLTTSDALFNLASYTSKQPVVDLPTNIAGIQIQGAGALTISASPATNTLGIGSDGIALTGSAGNTLISAPLVLGATQTWTNSTTSSTFTTSTGAITGGGNGLTITSSSTGATSISSSITGVADLTVNNTNTGTTTNTSTGQINFSGASISGTGTFALNNTSLTFAATQSSINVGSAISGFSAITVNNTAPATGSSGAISFTGTIAGTGTTLDVYGGNWAVGLTGTAANTFTGTTEVHSGSVTLQKVAFLGNGGGAIGGDLIIDASATVMQTNVSNGQPSEQIADTSSVTINSGGLWTSTANPYETVANLAVNGTINDIFAIVAGSGSLSFGNGSMIKSTLTSGTGGLTIAGNAASSNVNLYLHSDVSYINPVSGGATLGFSTGHQLWLNGDRTFDIAAFGQAGTGADLTITNGMAIMDGIAPSALIKTGAGVMKLTGGDVNGILPTADQFTDSGNEWTGGTRIENGTLLMGVANALPVVGTVTFGATGTAGTLNLGSFSTLVSGLAVDGASLGTNLITATSSTPILTVDTFAANSDFSGVIQNGTGTVGLTKSGAFALNLGGINTYTGATKDSRGVLNDVGQTGSSAQSLGSIAFNMGEGTVESTYDSSVDSVHTTVLNFSSLVGRTAGAAGNFVTNGGANGSTNVIKLTGRALGFIDQGTFFDGADYAFVNSAGGYVRAPVYDGDVNFNNAAGALVTGTSVNYQVASTIDGQGLATVNTIKFEGALDVDLSLASATLTLNAGGLLRSGGGSTTISDAGSGSKIAISATSNTEYVFRTDTRFDSLTINVPITNVTGSNALTKSGAGTLTLGASNTYKGTTYIDAGTVVAANTQALGLATAPLQLNGGTLDLATNASITAYNTTVASDATILSDTGGLTGGILHTLGTLTFRANSGDVTLTVDQGANVEDGNAALGFGVATLSTSGVNGTINNLLSTPVTLASLAIGTNSGGNMLSATGTGDNAVAITGITTFTNTAILNPTTANFYLGAARSSTSAASTLQLNGTSTGNTIASITQGGSQTTTVEKVNTGVWTITGAVSGTVAINIRGGEFILGPAASASTATAITVDNSTQQHATLGGTGTAQGTVTVRGNNPLYSAGHITPGIGGAGTLTVGNLTLAAGAGVAVAPGPVMDFTLGAPGATDHSVLGTNTAIAVNGILTLVANGASGLSGNQTINLADGIANLNGSGSYQLMTYGAAAGFSASTSDLTSMFTFTGFDDYSGPLTVTNLGAGTGAGKGIWLDFNGTVTSPVPEPASLAILGMGAAALLIRRRRPA